VSCDLSFTNYQDTAKSLNAEGYLLNSENEDKMEQILKDAIEGSRTGKSILVNAIIGKTDFRQGSLSV
jgi:hypothetical protein